MYLTQEAIKVKYHAYGYTKKSLFFIDRDITEQEI